jgi:DNA-binding LacI/PurR family transcriptional regulator
MSGFERQLLHDQIADALRRDLSLVPAGTRLQADEILAKRYSVSLAVMRKALQLLSADGLILRKKRVGSFVTEELARRKTLELPIGITLDRDPSGANDSFFFIRIVQCLRRVMSAKGFRTKLYIGEPAPSAMPSPQTCNDFYDDLFADRVSGIIAVSDHTFGKWFTTAMKKQLPTVGATLDYTYSVGIKPATMYDEAARILALQGRRRVSLIQWSFPWSNPKDEPSEKPFVDALVKYGIEVRKKWIFSQPLQDPQAGWHAFQSVWNAYPDKPNAIFIADDVLFPNASAAIVDAGVKVPDELLVVTHANRGSGTLYQFPLVALTYDPDECAELMSDMMVKLMHKKEVFPKHVELPFRIVDIDKTPASA